MSGLLPRGLLSLSISSMLPTFQNLTSQGRKRSQHKYQTGVMPGQASNINLQSRATAQYQKGSSRRLVVLLQQLPW